MTQFSSGKHAKLTADPEPWEYRDGTRQGWGPGHDGIYGWSERVPRPEFDRPLTNPANPILAAFREYAELENFPLNLWVIERWQFAMQSPEEYGEAGQMFDRAIVDADLSQAEAKLCITHARAVLTRLAALTQTEGAH